MKKYSLLIIISLLFCQIGFSQNQNTIEPELQDVLDKKNDDMIRVNIILKAKFNNDNLRKNINVSDNKSRREIVVEELKRFSRESQEDIMSILENGVKDGNVKDIAAHWLSNSISCTLSREYIYMLSEHHDIDIIGYNKESFLLWDTESEIIETQRGITQNITHVKAKKVWDLGYTGEGVLVGMLDTGLNIHKDLENNLWDGGEEYPNHGYNTYENNHDISDGYGHGTHCAGTICGDGTSGTQTGIAPDAKIMCIKVMDDVGNGTAESISAGIEFAIEHGADVLNMSLGFPNAPVATRKMLRESYVNALESGIAAITAVGNDGMFQISCPVPNNVRVPGGCPPPWTHPDQKDNEGGLSACIAVGAVDYSNTIAPFSSYGPFSWQNTSFADYKYNPNYGLIGLIRPDVVAPGVGIISCDPNNSSGYLIMDGTSQAAPCVTGIVCLMLQKRPNLTPAQICETLENTATKLSENKSNYTGSGCVNALLAIEEIDKIEDDTNVNSQYENNFDIFPNPAENNIVINTNEIIKEINIYNITGISVINEKHDVKNINISNLKQGIYFIKINTEKGDVLKKFIKQ